jgi:signal recognition particle subunit SRP19
LKDYKRYVLWLDYFNSSITREQGRRIPLDRSVKDPKLDELVEATTLLGYSPESEALRHPKRISVQSGCVSIEKRSGVKKGALLIEVAKSLSNVRGKRALQQQQSVHPSQGKGQKSTAAQQLHRR